MPRGSAVALPATAMPEPVHVGDLNLDRPLPTLAPPPRLTQARLLARLHTRPIGEVVLGLAGGPLSPRQLAAEVWPQVRERVARHLEEDQLAVPSSLPAGGLQARPVTAGVPKCLAGRADHAAPSMTVVIATRDRTDSLERCLASLERVHHREFDVVVVDSAPATSATEQLLASSGWRFPVRYLRSDRPGLALAHNTALGSVTGEVVAFTDDDVEVDPWWLTALGETFSAADVTCVTGLILPAELETPAQLWVEQAGGFDRGFVERRFSLQEPPEDRLFPFSAGRFGSGANMAFRTDWLRARGGFDPATGAGTPARGGDDLTAFCRVVLDRGVLVYQPAAIVRHWHRREYEGLRRQSFGYGVGLGAYLAATVSRQPSLVRPMLRRTAPAAAHLLASTSEKNQGKRADFPAELTWRERAGVVVGPAAYLVSRWRYRPRTGSPVGQGAAE